MQLARVIGNVVSTVKNASLEGRKLLVIQILDGDLRPVGKPLVAIDSVGAGAGELVFWCRGKEASFALDGSRSADRLHNRRHCRFGIAREINCDEGRNEGRPQMILARVLGNVVATQKNSRYEDARIMLVQPINPDGAPRGASMLALDSVDAGEGDIVIVVQEGWSASTASTGEAGAAIDSAIIGVVDSIEQDIEENVVMANEDAFRNIVREIVRQALTELHMASETDDL